MLKRLTDFLFPNKRKVQTFTYYIPGPPERKTPYRESQFDREFYSFINKGYDIISIHTVPHQGQRQTGMWFIATVRAKNNHAEELNLGDDFKIERDESFEIEYEHHHDK